MERDELLTLAIDSWGEDAQIMMCFEEMAELQNILAKLVRGRETKGDLASEIADVKIMLDQLEIIFDIKELVKDLEEIKLERLRIRLEVS
jgi:hypothetical protein